MHKHNVITDREGGKAQAVSRHGKTHHVFRSGLWAAVVEIQSDVHAYSPSLLFSGICGVVGLSYATQNEALNLVAIVQDRQGQPVNAVTVVFSVPSQIPSDLVVKLKPLILLKLFYDH
jgi:hypothetical protein